MKETAYAEMPLWKWILVLIGAFFIFTIFTSFAEVASLGTAKYIIYLCPIASFVAGCVVLAAYFGWCRLVEKHRPVDLPLSVLGKDLCKGLGIGFGLFAVITAVLAVLGFYHFDGVQFNASSLVASFSLFFVVGICEEVLFRGIIFKMIDGRYNIWVALGVSAIIFGLVHWGNDNATLWSCIAIAIEAGIMLALAYKYSANLWLPIGIHWAWNFTQGNVFGFAVSGQDAGGSIIRATVTGPDILTGGSFGPEASVLAIIVASIYTYYLIKKLELIK